MTGDGARAHNGKLGQEGGVDRLLPEVSPAPRHPDSRFHRVQVQTVQQQVRGRSGTRFNGTFGSPVLFPFPQILIAAYHPLASVVENKCMTYVIDRTIIFS